MPQDIFTAVTSEVSVQSVAKQYTLGTHPYLVSDHNHILAIIPDTRYWIMTPMKQRAPPQVWNLLESGGWTLGVS